jgi:hypothetical protein
MDFIKLNNEAIFSICLILEIYNLLRVQSELLKRKEFLKTLIDTYY